MNEHLTLKEEEPHAHIHLTFTTISKIWALWSCLLFALAVLAAFRDNRPVDEIDVLTPNYTQRIWYGWIATTCYVEQPEYADGKLSLLRAFQLRALPHYITRFAFFFGITVMLFFSYCRMNRFLVKNANPSWITRLLVELQPLLHGVAIFYTALFMMLNKRVDSMEAENYMLSVQRFFVFTLAHMIVFAVQDHLDSGTSPGCSWRNKLRILCIVALSATFYPVLHTLRPFIEVAACHPYVPTASAYIEYAALLSILLFYYSAVFDLGDIELVVSVDRRDLQIDEVYGNEYKPQFSISDKSTISGGNKVFPGPLCSIQSRVCDSA